MIFTIFERKAQLWLKDKFHLIEYMEEEQMSPMLRPTIFANIIKEEDSDKEDDSHELSKESANSSKFSVNYEKDERLKSVSSEDNPFEEAVATPHNNKIEEVKLNFKTPKAIGGANLDTHGFKSIIRTPKISLRPSVLPQKMADDINFQEQVHDMLKLKYKYGFMKATSVVVLTVILLLMMCSIIFNCNAASVVLLLSVSFLCFKAFTFSSMIYINLIVVVTLIVQYGLALTNLSNRNSPMTFPDPFTDPNKMHSIGIPWYTSIGFFTQGNYKWAYYFSLMISKSRVLNLWYECIILLLTNIYFTNFYSTIYNQNIEISNEKNIKDIIKIQSDTLAKKYEAMIEEQFSPRKLSEGDFMIKADDEPLHAPNKNLLVRYTGVTDDEIDKMINKFYASSWTIKFYNSSINAMCSIGGLITLIFLLIITFDQTGLINLVYISFCLYHIFNFRKFLRPDEYTLPYHLKYIKIFIYIDLMINIMYQVPIQSMHDRDGRNGWQRVIGLFSFGYIDPSTKEMTFQNIGVVITKSIMFCLVLLLDSLAKSPAYKQFKEEKLKHFQEISMFKSRCLTYLYNNNKLRKIVKIQYEKDAMIQKIKLMKKQLSLWNKKYLNPDNLNEIRHHSILGLLDRHAKNEEVNPRGSTKSTYFFKGSDGKKSQQPFEFKLKQLEEIKEDPIKSERNMRVTYVKDDDPFSETSSYIDINDMHRDIATITHEEEEMLLDNLKSSKLNWSSRLLNWMKRRYSNQMLLISSRKRLKAIEEDLTKGKFKINTTIENRLLINYYIKLGENPGRVNTLNSAMPDQYKVENTELDGSLEKAPQSSILSTILGLVVSNSSILCYIFMIVAHIINGSLISLVYPVSIFCYALFEEIRPPKGYWKFILLYTMIVLIVKSIFKAYYVANAIPEGLNNFLKNFRVGIERVDENGLPTSYYLFEILIMLFVVIHIISLMLQGLWDKREVEIEAIDEAAVRVNRNKKTKVKSPRPIRIGKKKNLQRSASEDLHYAINASDDSSSEESKINGKRPTFEVASESPIKECGNPFKGRFENTIASRWRNFQSPIVYDMDLHHYDRQNAPNKMSYMETSRALTEYPYEEITFEEAQRFIDEEFSNTGLIQNYFTQTKRKLFKNNYFKRLFPIVSSQKPGRDFYAQMALVQFLCIIFIILFFTFMERDYTNITSQQLQVRQFSALLVVAVFLQIFFMLVDRYIYIAKSFSISKRASDDDDDIIDSTLARHPLFLSEASQTKSIASENKNKQELNLVSETPKIDITSTEAEVILRNLVQQMNKSSTYFIRPKTVELMPINQNTGEYRSRQTEVQTEERALSKLSSSIKLKYYLQWFLTIFIHIVLFWYLPSKSNNATQGHYY